MLREGKESSCLIKRPKAETRRYEYSDFRGEWGGQLISAEGVMGGLRQQ
jgi:hypothetical protein